MSTAFKTKVEDESAVDTSKASLPWPDNVDPVVATIL